MHQQMAQQVRSQGRGNDSMLMHMTPDEVNSLQGLAMAHGGSLTINPETGLPEAGWLGKLLPMILGAALAATGVGAPLAAGIVGAGQFARTGSLKKGLMAGLGAFGGAGLAGAAGVGGSLLGGNAGGLLGNNAGFFGANMGAGAHPTANITSLAAAATPPPTLASVPTPPASTAPVQIDGALKAMRAAPVQMATQVVEPASNYRRTTYDTIGTSVHRWLRFTFRSSYTRWSARWYSRCLRSVMVAAMLVWKLLAVWAVAQYKVRVMG
jgi:hypothetical protein